MTRYDYRTNSNGDVTQYKIVRVKNTMFEKRQAVVTEVRDGTDFLVSFYSAPGLFFAHPSQGEEWIVGKICGQWSLLRKTATQNSAALAMQSSDPGDVILDASNVIRVISPMRIDHEEVTYRNTGVGQVFADATVTRVQFNPVHVNSVDTLQDVITVTGASNDTITFAEPGTYNFRFMIDMAIVTTGRSFTELLFSGATRRRAIFTGDDQVCLSVTEKVGTTLSCFFNIFQTLGSTQTGSVDLKIIRLG